MDVHWAEEAMRDREAIFDFIATDNPQAALELDETLRDKADLLHHHPWLGHTGAVPGTRELLVLPTYKLVYVVDDTRVFILRVLHTARCWPPFESGDMT